MRFKNGELVVKRFCSDCQELREGTIDIDTCSICGGGLLMDPKEEKFEE